MLFAGKPDFVPGRHRFLLYAGVAAMLVAVVSIFGFTLNAFALRDTAAVQYGVMCGVISLLVAVACIETAMHLDRKARVALNA